MYQVTIINNDKSIVIMRPGGSRTMLTSAEIKTDINSIPSFTFSVLPNNPGYNEIMPMVTRVRVVRIDTGEVLFDGRVLVSTNEMAETGALARSYTCEGALAFFHDVVPGYQTFTGTPATIIKQLVDMFNSRVDPFKQMQLGIMPESTQSQTLETTPEKDLYDTLHDFVVTTLGYDIRVRSAQNGRFLDVKSQLGETGKTIIRLGINLKAMKVETDPTGIITRVVPLGAVKDNVSSEESVQPRVNLTDAGKSLYVDIPDLINKYGVLEGVQVFDNAKTPEQLQDAVNSWISGQRPVTRKFSITAVDLSSIGRAPEDFKVYNFNRVINPPTQTDEMMRIVGQTLDLIQPQNAELVIGDKFKSGIDYAVETAAENLKNQRLYGQLQQTVIGQSARIVSISKTAQTAQETVSKVQATVVELKESIDKADLTGVNDSLTKMSNQLTALFSNIGEIGNELSKIKEAQKTSTGATLDSLEKRIEILEKAKD
ncbi:phage tail protein [Lacticaseibacillus rhamnosus]|uniref:phage tail protein n=1 Tax=Lacticaseibacillus rhamnosus TaxID=47715 RepID=UPI003DA908F9